MIKASNEKGSLSLFVSIAMLFFMLFILALYISTTNEQKVQLAITARIKEIYEKNINDEKLEEIYNDFIGKDENIPIYTAEQLQKVGSGENVYISEVGKYYTFNLNSNYILKNNIELNKGKYIISNDGTVSFSSNAEQWIPIGTSSKQFTGIFDGNGYKIEGIYINSNSSNQGLFGYNQGTIQNVVLSNSYIKVNSILEGIAVYNYGTIKNCMNTIFKEN